MAHATDKLSPASRPVHKEHLHEAGTQPDHLPESLIDEAVEESFPASDPPALRGSTRLMPDEAPPGTAKPKTPTARRAAARN